MWNKLVKQNRIGWDRIKNQIEQNRYFFKKKKKPLENVMGRDL